MVQIQAVSLLLSQGSVTFPHNFCQTEISHHTGSLALCSPTALILMCNGIKLNLNDKSIFAKVFCTAIHQTTAYGLNCYEYVVDVTCLLIRDQMKSIATGI